MPPADQPTRSRTRSAARRRRRGPGLPGWVAGGARAGVGALVVREPTVCPARGRARRPSSRWPAGGPAQRMYPGASRQDGSTRAVTAPMARSVRSMTWARVMRERSGRARITGGGTGGFRKHHACWRCGRAAEWHFARGGSKPKLGDVQERSTIARFGVLKAPAEGRASRSR